MWQLARALAYKTPEWVCHQLVGQAPLSGEKAIDVSSKVLHGPGRAFNLNQAAISSKPNRLKMNSGSGLDRSGQAPNRPLHWRSAFFNSIILVLTMSCLYSAGVAARAVWERPITTLRAKETGHQNQQHVWSNDFGSAYLIVMPTKRPRWKDEITACEACV